jgi:hypothetical protein
MINWLRGSTKNRKETVKNLMELPEVNIQDWIDSDQHAELGKILRTPILRMAIRIVAESMPIPMPSNVSKESDIIFAAGVTAGYAHCLENLRKLSVNDTTKEPEATFDKQN